MAVQQATEQTPSSPAEIKQMPTPPPELADASSPKSSQPEKLEASSPEQPQAESGVASTTKIVEPDKSLEPPKVEVKEEELKSDNKAKDDSKNDDTKDDSKKDEKDDKSKDDPKSDDKDKSNKEDGKKEEEKKKALPRGMKADIKQLWAKTDAQCKCCTTWVEENPDDGKNVEESDECMQHAIVVRKKKKHEGNRKPLKVDSIVVHSPLIKKVLQRVFSGYPDLVIDLDELTFDAPFGPFFFRWEQFEKAVKDEEDEITKSHLKLLYDALQKELEKPIQRHNDLLRHKAIDFELLWTLYTPGTLMYSHDEGHDRLYETSDSDYWQDLTGMKFTIRCDTIDWDGETFGKVSLSDTINKFKGTRKITTLPSYPLRFHPKAEEMKKKCIERGRRFYELAGIHCKDYKGTAIEYTKYATQTVKSKRHLEGRIMLDEELFAKFNPDEARDLTELGEDEEDIKKSEAEAAERLAEQAKAAAEALKKAQEEEKKKDEDCKNEGANEKKETDEKSKSTTITGDNKESAKSTEATESKSEAPISLMEKQEGTTTKTEHDSSVEVKVGVSAMLEKDVEQTAKSAADKSMPSEPSASTDCKDKKEETTSSSSTDSEGIPTPASEPEEAEQEPKPFSSAEKPLLKDDQLAICSSWLRGYSLGYQKWAAFSVEHISDVSWNDDAFSELTLPSEYRELILATIQSQIRQNQWKQKMEKVEKEQKPWSAFSDKNDGGEVQDDDNPAEFDDFIAQKGLGYIMLFSGNPGVGKTATAESIAELLHVPLCIISVGNLGTSAESVESALQDILELASKWNAVLLLDEADIFLEQRTKHDLHRNAVVSVFLRLLEYYQGVLCLTTNRSEEIDVAFHSRIHISLPFPDLTETNREQIWRHFAKITNKKQEIGAAKRKALNDKKAPVSAPSDSQPGPAPSDLGASETGTKTTTDPVSTAPAPASAPQHDTSSLIDLSNNDFRKLSQTQMNGRQIKNAFKTAVLLASYKKEKVQMKHVKTALKTIDGNGLGKREVGRMYY